MVLKDISGKRFFALLLASLLVVSGRAQQKAPASRQVTAKAATSASRTLVASKGPQLVDITSSTGIRFEHLSSPEQRYIVESMGGGVALLDYDGDGWLDIYFTNSPSVAMALEDKKAKSALYRNNHDGTFTDVTDMAGVGFP